MKFNDIQCKVVVNVNTGSKIGHVCDIILDDRCLSVVAFIVADTAIFRYLNFFKEFIEIEIDITRVISIGEDVILVDI